MDTSYVAVAVVTSRTEAELIAGLRHAMFLTRIHDRLLQTGLAELAGPNPAPLRKAASTYQAAIDNLAQRAGIAA